MQAALPDLLVAPHRLDERRRGQVAERGQRSEPRDEIGERVPVRFLEETAPHGEVGDDEHAAGDGLAVPEAPVLRQRFDGVPGRVPEVQDAPRPALAFVLGHHLRLDAAGVGDDRGQRVRLAPDDGGQIARHPLEEAAVGDHAVLDHLVETGPELAAGQGAQHVRVGEDRERLVERADQVLAERMVDADLAADGTVDLREQRSRHVRQGDAPQVGRRRETHHVADHAAADGDDGDAALGRHADQGVVDPGDGLGVLGALAVGDEDAFPAAERPRHGRAVRFPDRRTRDDDALAAGSRLGQQRVEPPEETAAHVHRIGARRGGDLDDGGGHCAPVQ